jgi:low affinity Fe/Cu permease
LDELIRALKGARNKLVDLENLSEEELRKLEDQFQRLRKKAAHDGTHHPDGAAREST